MAFRGLGAAYGIVRSFFLGSGQAPSALGALVLSSTNFSGGGVSAASISNLTPGSFLSASSSDGTALSIYRTSGTTATLTGAFQSVGLATISLVETLPGSGLSPRATNIAISIVVGGGGIPANVVTYLGVPVTYLTSLVTRTAYA